MNSILYFLAKHKAVFGIIAVLVFGLVLSPSLAGAQGTDVFGIDYIEGTNATGSEGIALGTQDLRVTATRIINVSLSLLGIIAVVIVLIGGFRWMTAGGNEEKVTEARKWIFSGIIGLAIVLSAWAIAKFVLNQLGEATDVRDFEPS